MGWGKFRNGLVGGIKRAGQGAIDVVRGEADSDDYKALTRASTFGTSSLYDKYLFPEDAPAATVPGEDPRTTALRQRAYGEAKDFREALPEYEANQFRPEQIQANMAEEQGQRNVRRGTSARGLLNSGIRAKGEADIMTQKASTLAEARMNISRNANELADLKSDIATGIGISDTAAMNESASQSQQRAREEAAQRRAQYAQIGQGLGYAAGAYAGSPTSAASTGASTGGASPSAVSAGGSGYGGYSGVNGYVNT